jgi:hypothetical protein
MTAAQLIQTSILFITMSMITIKIIGGAEVSYWIKAVTVCTFLLSCAGLAVGILLAIWI